MATTHIRWIYWVINPIRTRTASASSHQLQRATDGYTTMSWYTIIKPQLLGWPQYWVYHGFPSFPLPLSQILLTSGPARGDLQSASSKCRLQPTPGKLRRSERGSPNVYVLTMNLQFWRVYTTHLQWIWGSLLLGFTTLSIFQPSGPSSSGCGSKHFKTQVITQGL